MCVASGRAAKRSGRRAPEHPQQGVIDLIRRRLRMPHLRPPSAPTLAAGSIGCRAHVTVDPCLGLLEHAVGRVVPTWLKLALPCGLTPVRGQFKVTGVV